jgi:protein ImuB
MLGQMGLRSIADCLRLPRAGFARRVGRAWLDELDQALGKLPDFRSAWRAPQRLSRLVEFSSETNDQAWFAEALRSMTASLEQELRQRQVQVTSVRLVFRHIRGSDTLTQMSYVEPVHEQVRLLSPLLAHIERMQLAEPALALAVETSTLVPLRTDPPGLLLSAPEDSLQPVDNACSDLALVENLRGRFGARSVFGIDAVAEHRPEYAWRRRLSELAAKKTGEPGCVRDDRPLWLLPTPRKWVVRKECQTQKVSDTFFSFFSERVESGWWDGQDVRRDYHVVTGESGEKLWLFRDRLTGEWYLHGIFG